MKKLTKLLSVLLALALVLQIPFVAGAQVSLKSKYTNTVYTHSSAFDGYDIVYGIDVSQHNGTIDFKKVKNDGIEYVFIRVGYTGYTKAKFSLNYDRNYKTYFNDAKAAGLKVGAYWYSQALNTNEATQEAKKLIEGLGGIELDLPVAYDYEFACTSDGRLDSANLSKAQKTANALAFLDTASAAGYDGCLYASENFLKTQMNAGEVAELYPVWLANYSTKTSYTGSYEYWQHTSKGKVDGISTNCDVNFRYVDNRSIKLENQTYTGAPITPQPLVIDEGKNIILTNNVDYLLTYENNIGVGTATIIATGIGAYAGFEKRYSFEIVPDAVKSLTYISCTDTTLSYSWDAVAGASQYKIYVNNNTAGTSFTTVVNTNSATLSNLTCGNQYSVKVCAGISKANGGIKWGEYSAVDVRETSGSVVSGLAVKSQSTSAIRIQWNKIVSADGYKIYMKNDTDAYDEIAAVDRGTSSYKVDDLQAGTIYYFKVAAVVGEEVGTPSSAIKAVTKPKKVTISKVKSPSKKKIKIDWKSMSASGYQIQWSTYKDFSKNYKSTTAKSSAKSKTIKTAQSKKKYYVRVRAYRLQNGKKIYGKWSSTKSVTTK